MASQKPKTMHPRIVQTSSTSDLPMYDVIILGGGLSGLFSAYKIYQKYPKAKVLLLESQNRLGGRIDTYEDKIYGPIEKGAARFNKKHKHLLQLIHELGLESNIKTITPSIDFVPSTPTNLPHTQSDIQKITKKIIETETPREVLQNKIFIDYIKEILPREEAQLYYDSFGYTSELTYMNAYDTIQLIKNHFVSKHFYSLKGGFTQIIDRLLQELSKHKNMIIQKNNTVIDIELPTQPTVSTTITASTPDGSRKYQGKTIISTLNKETIEHFPVFRPIHPYLKYIKNLPLCRIYAKFALDPQTGEPWFQGRHKFTTNNNLRMIIPMNAEKGTMMVTYTDNKIATNWNKIYETEGVETLNKKIHTLLKKTTKIENIPPLEQTKVFYWEHGVAYYGKGFDSTTMLKKIIQPYPNQSLYICGENYSEKNNQWMEGALDTVPLKQIFRDLNRDTR